MRLWNQVEVRRGSRSMRRRRRSITCRFFITSGSSPKAPDREERTLPPADCILPLGACCGKCAERVCVTV